MYLIVDCDISLLPNTHPHSCVKHTPITHTKHTKHKSNPLPHNTGRVVALHVDGVSTTLDVAVLWYRSSVGSSVDKQAGGAYIFRPEELHQVQVCVFLCMGGVSVCVGVGVHCVGVCCVCVYIVWVCVVCACTLCACTLCVCTLCVYVKYVCGVHGVWVWCMWNVCM